MRDPLGRRLSILASPAPAAWERWAAPLCLEAVRRAADAGYEVATWHEPGLGALAAQEAAQRGATITIALPGETPSDHWSRLLAACYGRAVRLLRCDIRPCDEWTGAARLHYRDALPAPLTHLATVHAAIERAEAVLLLPSPGPRDPMADHARWLCRLLGIALHDLSTIGGVASLAAEIGGAP
jgi:NAD(P)-dependent dehydrogenase (short-subunit alcohol dehydrogenase family)